MTARTWTLVVSLVFGACTIDADGDGVASDLDCDDADAAVFPGADERCDGVDNDCNGIADEPQAIDAPAWWVDRDADTWGDTQLVVKACDPPPGYASRPGDCDDEAEAVHPEADEIAGNGADDDCDPLTADG